MEDQNFIVEVLKTVLPFLASAGVGAGGVLATLRSSKQKEKREAAEEKEKQFHTEVEIRAIQALLSMALGLTIEELTLTTVQKVVKDNKNNLEALTQFIKTTPEPDLIWIKRRSGPRRFEMVQYNDHYHNLFIGGPRMGQYVGKTDHEVWPKEIADVFTTNDENCVVSGRVQRVEEYAASPYTGTRGTFTGSKWCFHVDQTTFVCGLGNFQPDISPLVTSADSVGPEPLAQLQP